MSEPTARYVTIPGLPTSVYKPPAPEPVDADAWIAEHPPSDRYVADCIDLGVPPRSLGTQKRRERVCVRAGLFFREYEWQEWEEPVFEFPWYLLETWRLPDGRKYARKTEITEYLAKDMIERGEVRRGR